MKLSSLPLLTTIVLTLAACGDDSSPGGAGGAGGSASDTSTSDTASSTSDAATTNAATTGAATTGAATTGATTTTSSTSSGAPATYDEACQALCDVENAALADAACEPNDCDDVCFNIDRPGCEPEAIALANCRSQGDVTCTCDGGVSFCSYVSDCFAEQEAYDACPGTCEQQGGGTPEQAAAAFDPFCDALAALAVDAGCTQEVDCALLRDLYLSDIDGCEAEATSAFDCAAAAYDAIDGAGCTCDGGNLSCPGLDETVCAAEAAALEQCTACG